VKSYCTSRWIKDGRVRRALGGPARPESRKRRDGAEALAGVPGMRVIGEITALSRGRRRHHGIGRRRGTGTTAYGITKSRAGGSNRRLDL
jgi:hypothetical protein